MKTNFRDAAVLKEKDGCYFCYRSSLMTAEECLFKGVPVASGYNAAGYPLNVLSNFPSRLDPHSFDEPFSLNVEVDGETVCRDMVLESFEKAEDNGALHCIATFMSKISPVRIFEHTVLDGTCAFTRYLEIENCSDRPVKLSRLVLHGGGIESFDLESDTWSERADTNKIYTCGYFEEDRCCREGTFIKRPLTPGSTGIDTRFGADRFRHPALFIFNNMTGVTYFVQVGWSAGVHFGINYDAGSSKSRTKLSYTAEISGYNPLYILDAGEKFTTPQVHFGAVHGGLDEAVNESTAHLRKNVLCKPEADGSAMLVGAGMGAEHDMSVETSRAFAKQMRDMGAEVFIIDAGWACPPGRETDWYGFNGLNRPDGDRYPDDRLMKLRDYCHSIGIKFALWMEPERLGDLSGIKEKHPDWVSENIYGESCGGVINMANPEAAQWVESEIERVVTEYKLDLLRIDFNIDGNHIFSFGKNGECNSLRHFSAVYGMFARLKAKFPDVIFENCASGGGRTDVGMLRNFNHSWVSDNQKMPKSIEITNGMTMVLPPERVDRLFAGMGCHSTGELYAHMRNTMLTHMSLNVISPACFEANAEAMEFIKHSVELYKNEIRSVIPVSKIYHHTPDRETARQKGCSILEIAAEDCSKSIIAAFTLPFANTDSFRISPKGISPDRRYTVYFDNSRKKCTINGSEIISNGLNVRINSALASELIILTEEN